ncbi:YciI family protein [Gordonia soli]|uniref:Uncharacterized protein n=1 Tax=Gordonia soli NBRC 108243 TaxID=1223545 RepID=M0QJN2_9ACTN|nr:YciI family protein [Gordonia soli]GAC68825.1 hypothetical protein GS4_19_00150 [Gordonia soli NBRC 108243]
MTDTYAFLIREPDWDSDRYLAGPGDERAGSYDGRAPGAMGATQTRDRTAVAADPDFAAHKRFQQAVADLGATIVGGAALQNLRHGGRCVPGRDGSAPHFTDASYAESSDVITGFYLVAVDDEEQARRIAALVPTGNAVEWRKVFPSD